MRAHEAKTRALAMPYKDSDPSQQKSRKCVFRRFLNRHQKKLFYSLFQSRQKYYESSKTEYSDSTSFINRLTPLNFFLGSWNFFEGLKGGFPKKISTFFKRRQVASIRPNVCWSVGRSVGRSVCRIFFFKSKESNLITWFFCGRLSLLGLKTS